MMQAILLEFFDCHNPAVFFLKKAYFEKEKVLTDIFYLILHRRNN